jgi:hypothetical protein
MTTITVHVGDDYYEVTEYLDDRQPTFVRYRNGKAPGLPVQFESLTPHQQNEIINRILKAKNAHRPQSDTYYRH